jgi:nucleotide-binding universal stress UspA family protein
MSPALTTVLAGVDGSRASQAAVGWAGGLAVACHANVHAVYAWLPYQSELSPSMAARERGQAEANVDAWCRPLRRTRASYKAEAVEGAPPAVLREEAERTDADLVVIGTRGRHGPLVVGLGAVTHELVHGLHIPVAVVPPATETLPAGPVVVGVDGSDANLVTVLWAAGLATALGRSLVAVHGLGLVETFGVEGWPQPDLRRIEAHLDLVREEHGSIPLETVPDFPGPALDEVADRHHAAAVVVGGLRPGLLADLHLGRTPVQLLQRGSGPVVVVPDRW